MLPDTSNYNSKGSIMKLLKRMKTVNSKKATLYNFKDDEISSTKKVYYRFCRNGAPKVFEVSLGTLNLSEATLEIKLSDIIKILKDEGYIKKA